MNINGSQLNQSVVHFLRRYHLIIFVITVFGALGAGIYLTYQNIIATDNAQGYTAQTNNTSFDAATIEHIKSLQPSDYRLPKEGGSETTPLQERDLPLSGRVNPFIE